MNHRIMVVDDNEINLKLISELLMMEGYNVLPVTDAESVLKLIETNFPELILMDIQLPGMDGLTLTKILKQKKETQHIPIIAVTAFAMKGDEEKALEAGCNGYITKPIDTRMLPELVQKYLQDHQTVL